MGKRHRQYALQRSRCHFGLFSFLKRSHLNLSISTFSNFIYKFILWVSDVVNMPYEDTKCFNGDCYGVCGELDWRKPLRFQRISIVFVSLFLYRFILWVSDVVNMPYEDTECFNGDCYGVCGEIDSPETVRGLDRYTTDVIIRQFRVALSELPALVESIGKYFAYVDNYCL